MSIKGRYLSTCHLVEITMCEVGCDGHSDHNHYCSHCGAVVDMPVLMPWAVFDSDTELVVRRYKDGDATAAEVSTAVQNAIRNTVNKLVTALQLALDDNKPDAWKFDVARGIWIAVVPPTNPPEGEKTE